MSLMDLSRLDIDGGTQTRVALNEAVVDDYAEALRDGVKLPAVTAFFDGSAYWLADGFHRFFAHKQAGKGGINVDVREGTKRDAVLFSTGCNSTHGLRRTNEDKRRAVRTLLDDAEWSTWSDREIAKQCDVSHTFVANLRNPEVATLPGTKAAKVATLPEQGAGSGGNVATEHAQKSGNVATAPADDVTYFGPSDDELDAAHASAAADMSSLMRLIETDDKLGALVEENKRLRAELAVVASARDGYMNRCNELIAKVKSLTRKLAKAEAAHV